MKCPSFMNQLPCMATYGVGYQMCKSVLRPKRWYIWINVLKRLKSKYTIRTSKHVLHDKLLYFIRERNSDNYISLKDFLIVLLLFSASFFWYCCLNKLRPARDPFFLLFSDKYPSYSLLSYTFCCRISSILLKHLAHGLFTDIRRLIPLMFLPSRITQR